MKRMPNQLIVSAMTAVRLSKEKKGFFWIPTNGKRRFRLPITYDKDVQDGMGYAIYRGRLVAVVKI